MAEDHQLQDVEMIDINDQLQAIDLFIDLDEQIDIDFNLLDVDPNFIEQIIGVQLIIDDVCSFCTDVED